MTQAVRNKGWTVVLAGLGINLALGVLYAWSVFKSEITASIKAGGAFDWDPASVNDPYAVCCLVFAFAMIAAGKAQDRFGPRVTAIFGGVLVGAGMILISRTTDYAAWVLGFGALTGAGLGFGYASATPPALKWFPPAKTGLVAGIVVSGFGLASAYIAPLGKYLIGAYGLGGAMMGFGIAFLLVVSFFGLFLVNPPEGYVPAGGKAHAAVSGAGDRSPSELFAMPAFWLLWIAYFIAAGAGLMVIGSVAGMAAKSLGEYAFAAVAVMAVGNAGGRLAAGALSDKIGRKPALMLILAAQAALMFIAIPIVGGSGENPAPLVLLAMGIGFNYGANLALFPAFTKDLWGMKHFGSNYGLVFTAWGVGGFVLSRVSQMLTAATGSYASSFMTAGGLLAAGLVLVWLGLSSSGRNRSAGLIGGKEPALSYATQKTLTRENQGG